MIRIGTYDIFEDDRHGVFQVRHKDEATTIEFRDDTRRTVFVQIVEHLADHPAASSSALFDVCDADDEPLVMDVIDQLTELGIISDETVRSLPRSLLEAQDGLFSRGGSEYGAASELQEQIAQTNLTFFQSPHLADLLDAKARTNGFECLTHFDVTASYTQEDVDRIVGDADLMVVNGDPWNPQLLEWINHAALEHQTPWIFLSGTDATQGTVGPLFFGDRSGCYECLLQRQKSCKDFLPYFEAYEQTLRDREMTGQPGRTYAAVYDLLVSIAMLEAVKFVTKAAVPVLYKQFLTLQVRDYEVQTHSVLKVPDCPACGQDELRPSPWLEPVSLA
jgi:bacteriocin biosynthesis cyclodehydratase domain-containing protein